jgi:hypothetical protein
MGDYRIGGDTWTFGIVASDKIRIWSWLGIGHAEELNDEIAYRTVNGRGSERKRKAPARRIG